MNKYDLLVQQQAEAIKRKESVEHQDSKKDKSSTQVETSVGQQVVGQKSCGLKPEESRPFRITSRFSLCEREILVRQAQEARLTVSEYIRASVLGPGYVSSIDPVKQKLLRDVSRELGRQGNNLNQIAKRMNAEPVSPEEGNSMLAIIARSLLSAHATVRQAMTEGRSEP